MTQNLNQSTEDTAYWQAQVDQFQVSSQTKTKFCKQNAVNYHRFLYWYTKLTKKGAQTSRPVDLIPVRVSKPETKESNDYIANVVLDNGVKINIFDEAVLFKIIESIG